MAKFKNHVELIGNLVTDIEAKRIGGAGTPVANFRIATNKSFKDAQGEWQEKATFHQCVMYGDAVANIEGWRKGQFVAAVGEISTRSYERKLPDGTVIPNWPVFEIKVKELKKAIFGAEEDDTTVPAFTPRTQTAQMAHHPPGQRAAYQSKSRRGPEPDWGGETLGVSLDDLPGEFETPKQGKTLKDIPY